MFANFTAAIIGSAGQFAGTSAAIVIGWVGIAIWLATGTGIFMAYRARRKLDGNTLVLLAIASFSILTAVLAAFGRAGFGIWMALESRHSTFSAIFWVAIFGLYWRLTGSMLPAATSLRVALLGGTLSLLTVSYLAWFSIGMNLQRRAAAFDLVTAELKNGNFVPEHIMQVYPLPEPLRRRVEFLREHKLSIFANSRLEPG